jgi:hypothetical protein
MEDVGLQMSNISLLKGFAFKRFKIGTFQTKFSEAVSSIKAL